MLSKHKCTRLLGILLILILFFESHLLPNGRPAFGVLKSHAAPIDTASITASSFAQTMNVGWNLGNSLDAYHKAAKNQPNLEQETIWGNPKTSKELIDYVKSLGFNTIRVPVSWSYHTYEDASGQLHVYPEWLARVKEVVNYCVANNMYVIMDSHHDNKLFYVGVSDSDFAAVCNRASTIWGDIAAYFCDIDGHLIFEAFNETDNAKQGRTFTKKCAEQMNQLNQVFVNTVRSTGGNNAGRLLIIPTLMHRYTDDFLNAFVLPKDTAPGKLLTSVHFYPSVYDQYLEPDFSRLQQFSARVGTPVIITEWGTTTKYSPSEFRTVHAANYVARANAHGLKCVYWDNGKEYSIVNRKNLSCNNAMINAIFNPVPYTSDSTNVLDDWSNMYSYIRMNEETGATYEDDTWGMIVLNQDGNCLIQVPQGATSISLQLIKSDTMSKQAFHFVYFYNSGYGLVDKINTHYGFSEKVIPIPQGATTVRICIYNAFDRTSADAYATALKNGTLKPIIRFY